MALITRQEQYRAGHWYTWVNVEGFNCVMLETPYALTEQEAATFQEKYLSDHQYDSVPQAVISIYEHKSVIRDALTTIKTTDPTLAQWNAYLGSLAWDEALLVRWFLAMLARELAQRNEVSLSNYTETEVLSRLKTWIIDTPARKLEKIVFNLG